MKKTNIKEEIDKIFQIVGEELNLSNNFSKDDYMKLPLEKKKIFDDVLEDKFNEKRGIFRTDFQTTIDKINKYLRNKYNVNRPINNVGGFAAIVNNDYSHINILSDEDRINLQNEINNSVKEEKVSMKKRISEYWKSIPKFLKYGSLISLGAFFGTQSLLHWSAWTISTGALSLVGIAGVGALILPAALAVYCGGKYIKNRIQKNKSEKPKKSLLERIKNKFKTKDIDDDLLEEETELNPLPDFEETMDNKANYDFVPPVPVFREGKKSLPDFEDENEKVQQPVEKPITEKLIPDFDDSLNEKINNNKEQLEQVKTKISNIEQEGNKLSEQLTSLRQNMKFEDDELPIVPDFVEQPVADNIEEDNTEKLLEGTFDKGELPEETFNNEEHKPKHLKKENEPSKEDIAKKIEEDIKSCENIISILQYKTILQESEEQKKYVKDKIKFYKNKLRRLKEQQKKQDLSNFDYQFAIRRKKLNEKLNKLERNDTNKKIIDDIEIAISQIDSYMKYSDAYKAGFITEEDLTTKGNSTYMVVDYVLNEKTKRSKK